MGEMLQRSILDRWRADPIAFIREILRDPETGRPFELFEAQCQFLRHAFTRTNDGRLVYPEQVFGVIKKSGKSMTAAMHILTMTLVHGGRFAEAYVVANDLEQAQDRVFQAVRRIVECSPDLKREAVVTQNRISFPEIDATITALASDYAGAAGANPVVSSFDELWAYTSERSRRLWDEMVPPPTRKVGCRLTTTNAGFSGESQLLEELYARGISQPLIDNSLHAGNGILMAWHREPVAPWQTEQWLLQMRQQLRPSAYMRMIQNQFVTNENPFINMSWWDACVDPNLKPLVGNRGLPVCAGVDASIKHCSTAIVVTHWDDKAKQVRVVFHRVFQPSPDEPLDFEATIERTMLDLQKRFMLVRVLYDPWQMQYTAQRLTRAGINVEEFPQSPGNSTMIGQHLYELIQSRSLRVYPDADMRRAVSHTVGMETPRGWRIGKDKQAHKVDVVVALAMASFAAVRGKGEGLSHWAAWFDEPKPLLPPPRRIPAHMTEAEYWRIAAPVSLMPHELIEQSHD
jgi:phage terminase large subunit-like protein